MMQLYRVPARLAFRAMGLFACAFLGCGLSPQPPKAPPATGGSTAVATAPLTAKLDVIVRPPERNVEPLVVTDEGALPVLPGGIMSLQVQLSEPAYVYVVWLDTQEQVLPLYPWNIEELEVRDLAAPPPVRQPAKTIYSPLLGGGWVFGDRGGIETVLLLARRTPLPKDVNLSALITPLPRTDASKPDELEIIALDVGPESTATVLHPASPASEAPPLAADHPVAPLLARLAPHFDLIRCARFAHASPPSSPP